jgi:DNA-binding transcriptional MerR regulator
MDLQQNKFDSESNLEKDSKDIRLNRDFGADIDLLMTLVPDRMGFKIGEVSQMLGLKNHILRYWESEFPVLKPQKAQNNQRMYTRKEIEKILLIRKLLYVDRFSISGAKRALRDWQKGASKNSFKAVNKESYLKLGAEIKMLIEKIAKVKKDLEV